MALDYAATINALYLAYFGRAADPAGLAYWEQKLAFFNGDPTQIIVSFQASTEAQTRFAQVSVADQITAIYKTLFNRAPDQEGLAYWAGRVNAGESIGKVSLAIYNAAIGTDGQIAALRAKASSDFSNSLNALAIDYFSEDAVTVSRAVIAAIRPGASNSDITDAVNTATGLAMSATSNPGLLSSLNGGKSIVELFDTARKSAEKLK